MSTKKEPEAEFEVTYVSFADGRMKRHKVIVKLSDLPKWWNNPQIAVVGVKPHYIHP